MNNSAAAASIAVITPAFGPAVVTLFGIDVPVLSFSLSLLGLLLARSIAPASRRKLNRRQEAALTLLLILILFLAVTGQLRLFGDTKPLTAGISMAWGIGLGTSGLLCIEFFGSWVMDMLKRILYGIAHAPRDTDQ